MEAAARDATGDEPDAVESVAKRLNRTLDNVDRIIVRESPSATATATGGGAASTGFIVAICGLFLMLGLNSALLLRQQEMSAQIRRLEDYQMTTFMLVPKLREEVEKQLSHRPAGQEQ